jgi:hypothetical protein
VIAFVFFRAATKSSTSRGSDNTLGSTSALAHGLDEARRIVPREKGLSRTIRRLVPSTFLRLSGSWLMR